MHCSWAWQKAPLVQSVNLIAVAVAARREAAKSFMFRGRRKD
jgi:hypothetical protein